MKPQNRLAPAPHAESFRPARAAVLCLLLLAGCGGRPDDWQSFEVDPATRPVSLEWASNGPDAILTDVQFVSEQEGWVAGDEDILWHTADGGKSWHRRQVKQGFDIEGFHVQPQSRRMWVAGGLSHDETQDGVLLTSGDGGRTWETLYTDKEVITFRAVHFSPDGRFGCLLNGQRILYSDDSGRTWRNGHDPEDWLVSEFHFLPDGRKGWAVARKRTRLETGQLSVSASRASRQSYPSLLATDDGGQTWRQVGQDFDSNIAAVSFLPDGVTGWVLLSVDSLWERSTKSAVMRTTDGGATWRRAGDDLPQAFNAIYFSSVERGWLAGGEGTVSYTEDGGQSWSHQPKAAAGDLMAVHFLPGGTKGWAVGGGGSVVNTGDGRRWESQLKPFTNTLTAVHFSPGGKEGWAAGRGGIIVHTADGGETWNSQHTWTKANLFSLQFASGGRKAWALGDKGDCTEPNSNTLVTSEDGGATWSARCVRNIASMDSAYFLPDGRGWATTRARVEAEGESASSKYYILHTRDGGSTWSEQHSVEGNWGASNIYFTPDGQHGWAGGSDDHILHTSDGGRSWVTQETKSVAGSAAWINAVAFTADGRHGWAVGYVFASSGDESLVLHTKDGGQSWLKQTVGKFGNLSGVYFAPDGQRGWAWGENGVVLHTADGGANWQGERGAAGTESTLAAGHFAAGGEGMSGWIVGENGVALRSVGRKFHPLVERYRIRSSVGGVELHWQLAADPAESVGWKPEELRWTVEYCAEGGGQQCDEWRKLLQEERLKPVAADGRQTFSHRWNPGDKRISADTRIHYRISAYDGHLRLRPQTLGSRVYQPWWERAPGWLKAVVIAFALLAAYVALCFVLLWRKPRALLWLHEKLSARELIEPWAPAAVRPLLPATLAFVPWFARHRRVNAAWAAHYLARPEARFDDLSPSLRAHYVGRDVSLDAWVEKHLPAAREVFLRLQTVAQRGIHILMPVRLETAEAEQLLAEPQPADFSRFFQPQRAAVAIVGIGGAGKSSLACLLARWAMSDAADGRLAAHRMIPVLIEEETPDLLAAVREKLRITASVDDLSDELLLNLLARKRILVIIDALSEKSREMQAYVANVYGGCPAHALVLTARRKIEVTGAAQATVRPEEVTVDRLAYFLLEYLRYSKREDLFPRRKAIGLADRLLSIAEAEGKDLPLTPLLIVLFVRQAIALVERGEDMERLPASIPETMIQYLKQLNSSGRVPEDRLISSTLVLARCSLGGDYVPQDFERQRAADALSAASLWGDGHNILSDLFEAGVLERRELAGTTFYRFKFDPVAEYMAALERVRTLAGDAAAWEQWLAALRRVEGYPRRMDGFLAALEVCVSTYQRQFNLPAMRWPWDEDNYRAQAGPPAARPHAVVVS